MKINDKNLVGFASSSSPIDKEGWLLKRGEVNKNFQRRWFTLKGNLLFYYEKKTDKEPSGVIILEGCTIELAEYEEQYAFKIVFHGAGDRTYILGADSQEAMEAWMKALACASYDYMKLMVSELQRQLDEIVELEKAHASIFDDHGKVSSNNKSLCPEDRPSAGDAPQAPSRLRRGHSQPKKNYSAAVGQQRINPFDREAKLQQPALSSSHSAPGTPVAMRHANKQQGNSTQHIDLTKLERSILLKTSDNSSTAYSSRLCRPFFDLQDLYGVLIKKDIEAWNKKVSGDVGATANLIDLRND